MLKYINAHSFFQLIQHFGFAMGQDTFPVLLIFSSMGIHHNNLFKVIFAFIMHVNTIHNMKVTASVIGMYTS